MPLYLLRHCPASGQAPDAPLTDAGRERAERLAEALPTTIAAVVASPWRRAVDTAAPLARARGLPLTTDARLTEYVLAPSPRDDWRDQLRANFADVERAIDGGESLRAAAGRFASLLGEVGDGTLVVTHGGLLAALARSLDPGVGFDFWQRLGTPAMVTLEGGVLREVPIFPERR